MKKAVIAVSLLVCVSFSFDATGINENGKESVKQNPISIAETVPIYPNSFYWNPNYGDSTKFAETMPIIPNSLKLRT